ncbi:MULTISPECIES: alpha-amylase family protein [Proteiniphilum]|jgi:hypothetical protein|uniref:hypothetical protein n=3 Tax=Dysgonomonadaceae TaxID=2005520 RepID=UPI001EEBCFC2|nr:MULTISPECIES: hypothetical protein [Proteiniphilum]ULB34634.1 hypothetical protein KDN43_00790 [Proteiniphilum propionicum]
MRKRIILKKTAVPVILIALILSAVGCTNNSRAEDNDIVIENSELKLILSSNGTAKSLIHKPTQQECLLRGANLPVFSIRQERPYDNEHQLAYPAISKEFSSDTIYQVDDQLVVGFELIDYQAYIDLKITDHYIGFALEKLEYHMDDIGIKRKTEIDEFTLLQIPLKERSNFGEWLNVMWDENVAVNLLAANPTTKIESKTRDGCKVVRAGGVAEVQIEGIEAVLIATETAALLDRIDRVERDYGLPLGVESRRCKEYKNSYYELRNVTTQNIDEHISFAKQGGFKQMVIYYTDFAASMGHFPWKFQYPGGMKDLQEIVKKIEDAGMIAGLHLHYNKAGINDSYVTPIPDSRLNVRNVFTLSKNVNRSDTVITVEENPDGTTLEDGRRYLKIGNELVSYKGYTTSPPYQFTGCQRGALHTSPNNLDAGYMLGILDVDTWPVFVRFNQRTGIQEEVAERLANIYDQAGFKFIYFDGAEDVPPPYWYNVSKAQLDVYKAFKNKPLFSEGACKSHFSWHILTRGNAFDIFRPEVIKEATRIHPVAEARLVSNDFTGIDFGWVGYVAPDKSTIGIQPDMLEYITSRAAGWNSIISLIGNLDQLKAHPRTGDNLEVIRRWEEVREKDILTAEQKRELRESGQEHILLVNENGDYELVPYQQITDLADGSQEIRAFIFERNSKIWVVYWHISGESNILLPVNYENIKLFEELGKEIPVEENGNGINLPVGNRKYAQFDLPREKVIEIFSQAVLQ